MSTNLKINQLFICYKVDDLQGNENHCIGLIDIPEELSDWELHFLQSIKTDVPSQLTVECSGSLSDRASLSDLLCWSECYEVNLPSEVQSALYLLSQDNESTPFYSDEEISQTLDSTFATESLAALEGPFDSIKKKLAEIGASKQVKAAKKVSGELERLMTASETELRNTIAGAGADKLKPTEIQPAQVVISLLEGVEEAAPPTSLPPCFALLQNKKGFRSFVDVSAALIANTAQLSQLGAFRVEEPADEKKIITAQSSLVLAIEKSIKAEQAKLGDGAQVVGYTNEKSIKDDWGIEAASAKQNALVWENGLWTQKKADEFNKVWKSLAGDIAKREKIVDAVFPKKITAAAKPLKAYFKQMEQPFTHWLWALLLQQAKANIDPKPQAIEFILSPRHKSVFPEVFYKLGVPDPYKGLDLSIGTIITQEYTEKNTKSPKDVAQIVIIHALYYREPTKIESLRSKGQWKDLEAMNKSFSWQRSSLATSKTDNAQKIRSYWQAFNKSEYDKNIANLPDKEVIRQFNAKVASANKPPQAGI